MWNSDLLAGYSLEQRVEREARRRTLREIAHRSAPDGEVFQTPHGSRSASPLIDAGTSRDERPSEVIQEERSGQPISSNREDLPLMAENSVPESVKALTEGNGLQPLPGAVSVLSTQGLTVPRLSHVPHSPDLSEASASDTRAMPPPAVKAFDQTTGENVIHAVTPTSAPMARSESLIEETSLSPPKPARQSPTPQTLSPLFSSEKTAQLPPPVEDRPLHLTHTGPSARVKHVPLAARSRLLQAITSSKSTPEEHPKHIGSLAFCTTSDPKLDESLPLEAIPSIPPHREAAMRRRELGVRRSRPNTPPIREAEAQEAEQIITAMETIPTGSVDEKSPERRVLPSKKSTLEATELFELFDDNQGESSAQGAARAALVQTLMDDLQEEEAVISDTTAQRQLENGSVGSETAEKLQEMASAPPKRRPAPPPPLKLFNGRRTRKPSIIGSADKPITPQPRLGSGSAPSLLRQPGLRTRRRTPPPPPNGEKPVEDSIRSPTSPDIEVVPQYVGRSRSSTMLSDQSEKSAFSLSFPAPPPPRWIPRGSPLARPKGPRPSPVPAKSWSSFDRIAKFTPRSETPSSERSFVSGREDELSVGRVPVRALSERDIRTPNRGRSLEYTELDLLAHRLRGTDREYEVGLASFAAPRPSPKLTLRPSMI